MFIQINSLRVLVKMRQRLEKTVSGGEFSMDLIARSWWNTSSHGYILAFTRAELNVRLKRGESSAVSDVSLIAGPGHCLWWSFSKSPTLVPPLFLGMGALRRAMHMKFRQAWRRNTTCVSSDLGIRASGLRKRLVFSPSIGQHVCGISFSSFCLWGQCTYRYPEMFTKTTHTSIYTSMIRASE